VVFVGCQKVLATPSQLVVGDERRWPPLGDLEAALEAGDLKIGLLALGLGALRGFDYL
jgi:hypothetical protein